MRDFSESKSFQIFFDNKLQARILVDEMNDAAALGEIFKVRNFLVKIRFLTESLDENLFFFRNLILDRRRSGSLGQVLREPEGAS